MTWEQLKQGFTSGIASAYDASLGRVERAVSEDADRVKRAVAAFFEALAQARANLDRALTLLPSPPANAADAALVARYTEMRQLYDALLLGISKNAVAVAEREVGIAPAVVLVIGVVGLTAAGVAWALAAYEYAAALRDQSGFLVAELEARKEAMRTGKALPPASATPSTPAPASPDAPPSKGGGWGWVLVGLGLAGGAVYLLPKLGKG